MLELLVLIIVAIARVTFMVVFALLVAGAKLVGQFIVWAMRRHGGASTTSQQAPNVPTPPSRQDIAAPAAQPTIIVLPIPMQLQARRTTIDEGEYRSPVRRR